MKNITRIILFCLFPVMCSAQEIRQSDSVLLVPDSAHYSIRSYNVEQLEEYRADDDFDYTTEQAGGESLWQRFVNFVIRIWKALFSVETTTWLGRLNLGEIIIYTVCLGVFVYALYKLFRMKYRSSFRKSGETGIPGEFLEEDIHDLDFDQLIAEALAAHHYRIAIRLVYLQALKILTDKDLILWEPAKTNHDYSFELEGKDLKKDFDHLSFYFDYAWYGDFRVGESHVAVVRELFNHLKSKAGE